MATNHIRMRCGSRASNHIRMQCGSRANMHNHKMKVERNEKAEKSRKGEKVWITDSGLGSGGKAGTHHTCGGKWAEPHHIYINYCLNQNNYHVNILLLCMQIINYPNLKINQIDWSNWKNGFRASSNLDQNLVSERFLGPNLNVFDVFSCFLLKRYIMLGKAQGRSMGACRGYQGQ